MKNIATSIDIKSILIDVSQEIEKKNILNFTKTSLDLNNIKYSSSDTIYCVFLLHSNQYQIFVFNNSFKYMIFELLHFNIKDVSTNIFTLYITKTFFVIFKNNSLYTYQEINQSYSKNELEEYVSKKFNLSIINTVELDDIELNRIIEDKDLTSNISILKNINVKSNKAFYLYLVYLIFCILSTLIYQNYEENIYSKKSLEKLKESKKVYLNTIKELKFNPYELVYTDLINTIKKFKLKLISLDYTSKTMNIKVSSKKKDNLYLFLDYYKKRVISNSIDEVSSKNIFISVLNVKIN